MKQIVNDKVIFTLTLPKGGRMEISMRNIKLTLSYDGSRYQGWQHPAKPENTVSGKLSEVLHRMTGEDIRLFCGAKTDSGIHAVSQTVNFKTGTSFSANEIRQYLNHYLPQDIAVHSSEEVDPRFHAALNARSSTYMCRILTAPTADVFRRKYTLHIPASDLDLSSMKDAARLLEGKHDFARLSSGRTRKSTERELYSVRIQTPDDTAHYSDELHIIAEAGDFLQRMPVLLYGLLLDVGLHRTDVSSVQLILNGDVTAPQPCPSHAVSLVKLQY